LHENLLGLFAVELLRILEIVHVVHYLGLISLLLVEELLLLLLAVHLLVFEIVVGHHLRVVVYALGHLRRH